MDPNIKLRPIPEKRGLTDLSSKRAEHGRPLAPAGSRAPINRVPRGWCYRCESEHLWEQECIR